MSLPHNPSWVTRTDHLLAPDCERVVARIFLPGQELIASGESRASAILERVLTLTSEEVDAQLVELETVFKGRHRNLHEIWQQHFAMLEHRLVATGRLSVAQRALIGAYFTQEYSIEGAALFNPSIVAHPNQSDLAQGSTRFVMTLRAVGEGHISSIEFRTGVVDVDNTIMFDPAPQYSTQPMGTPIMFSRLSFEHQINDMGGDKTNSDFVLESLPEFFSRRDLDRALDELRKQKLTRGSAVRTIDRFEWIAAGTYGLEFAEDVPLQERVIMPKSPAEKNGMEDVRMVEFQSDNESRKYFGTYTAYNGQQIASQLISTTDFNNFTITQFTGPGSLNKGMALFPRKIGDSYYALSRADRESNGIACSNDLRHWEEVVLIQTPHLSWEIVQLGNCGSPIETRDGWLVLTHGVGPMRQYAIGAMLLDLNDPTLVLGQLSQPLLTPSADERSGYVPNVVYSCGALLHNNTLVLPYGCSDTDTRIALVDLDALLENLRISSPQQAISISA